MPVNALYYIRPYGRRENITISHVEHDDADWLNSHGIKLSLESDGRDGYIIYADYGKKDEDGEPVEHILIAKQGQTCVSAFAQLVTELKEKMSNG